MSMTCNLLYVIWLLLRLCYMCKIIHSFNQTINNQPCCMLKHFMSSLELQLRDWHIPWKALRDPPSVIFSNVVSFKEWSGLYYLHRNICSGSFRHYIINHPILSRARLLYWGLPECRKETSFTRSCWLS
jgi:hypothetical protein